MNKPLKLKIGQLGLLVVLIPVLVGLCVLGALFFLLQESEQEIKRERQAKTLMAELSILERDLDEMHRSLMGLSESGSSVYKNDLEKYRGAFWTSLDKVETGLETAGQKEAFGWMKKAAEATVSELTRAEKSLEFVPRSGAAREMAESSKKLEELRASLRSKEEVLTNATVDLEQSSLLRGRDARESVKLVLVVGVIFFIVAAIALSRLFSRTIADRLKVLADNSFRLASGLPMTEKKAGVAEIEELSELDKSFHWMARQLEESARKERAMTENAIDVICSINDAGNLREVNAAAIQQWGYRPDEILGQRFLSIVRESDRDATAQALQAAREGGSQLLFENGIRHKQGHYVEVMWSGGWSPENNAMFCVAHDITEKKKIENLKRDLVNMVSHDLRTPLTSVQVFLEMLADGRYDGAPDKMRRKARVSESDIGRLISMVNSLLELERMDAGHIEIVAEKTSVQFLVDKAVDSVQSLADKADVSLQKSVSDSTIVADEDKLVQVLINLLSNAIKFSPAGSEVTVRAAEEDGAVAFQVIDSGRGISAEHIEQIFDRFKQVEISDSRVKGGAGLGLAVCKMLIEAHGGKIWATSRVGEGSTFHFLIPKR